MEFQVVSVLSLNASSRAAMASVRTAQAVAYVACAGSGAVLQPLDASGSLDLENQKFYYEPPAIPANAEQSAIDSPTSSPGSSPSSARKIPRVNKSNCLDVANGLLVIGESGGYLPRVLLYDLETRNCLDVKRDQHSFGVLFAKFSPSGSLLVTLGTPQDGFIYLYSTKNRVLDMVASNKCISTLKDVMWINDTQFVTIGVRHVKVWSYDGDKLTGRSVILGNLADQTFESLCRYMGNTFLVGTSRGQVYKLPDAEFYCEIEEERPINSIVQLGNMLILSTSLHVYKFVDSFLVHRYEVGADGLILASTLDSGTVEIDRDVLILTSNNDSQTISQLGGPVLPFRFSKPGLRLKNSTYAPTRAADLLNSVDDDMASDKSSTPCPEGNDMSASEKIICWYDEDKGIVEWPDVAVPCHLNDISAASYDSTTKVLMLGSLTGGVELNHRVMNSHTGPVTDCHVTSRLAASSGRDRKVKVWHAGDDGEFKFVNELVFSAPVLKLQIIETEHVNALVCCCSNKTLYFYTSSTYEFSTPRTLPLKASPYDMKAYKRSIILSTNDKTISIFDPFSDDKQKKCRTWRPVAAASPNDVHVNLSLVQPMELNGKSYLLGAASNKCVMMYTLLSGELTACQWGHGEQVSGIAWTGSRLVTASDTVFISSLVPKQTEARARSPYRTMARTPGRSPVRSPLRSSLRSPPSSPKRIPRSATSDGISRARTPEPQGMLGDYLRKPVSPRAYPYAGSQSPNATSRPARPGRTSPNPSRSARPSPPPSPSPSPRRQPRELPVLPAIPNLQPLPIPSFQHMLKSSALPLETRTDHETGQAITRNLRRALTEFINSDVELKGAEGKSLNTLLLAALAKTEGLSVVDSVAERLSQKIEQRLNLNG